MREGPEPEMDDRLRQSILRDRRIRQTLLEHGTQPYGDREINPQRKQTAFDYYRWMRRASSTSIHAGAYLGNLEREEHLLEQNSYPPEHPRHSQVEAGNYYPGRYQAPPAQPSPPTIPTRNEELRSAVEKTFEQSSRPNTISATCTNCGKTVEPGQGVIVRRPSGYGVIHKNEG